ncbi:hypothetical protein BJV82DRAFT_229158 [Fennellomyces sp. T-0311]|nr:hypothetical protein BJV82DRAFT_229158 [Fennellomyces sp. T-0311]
MANGVDNALDIPSDAQQLAFMSTMPSEIIPFVFSHLNQRDCMNCMAVCRSWYIRVPQYSRRIWEKLSLSIYDIHMDNRRFERCLGSHVRSITFHVFDDEELHRMMQKLIHHGCTKVQSLGKSRKDGSMSVRDGWLTPYTT